MTIIGEVQEGKEEPQGDYPSYDWPGKDTKRGRKDGKSTIYEAGLKGEGTTGSYSREW